MTYLLTAPSPTIFKVALVANQAALRLELAVVKALQRRVARTEARVRPVLDTLTGRLRAFKDTTEKTLAKLAAAASAALLQVNGYGTAPPPLCGPCFTHASSFLFE